MLLLSEFWNAIKPHNYRQQQYCASAPSTSLPSYLYNYSAPVGERSIAISLSVCVSVCLFASISLELLDRSSQIFCADPLWRVAIRYVLPVLWMTSRLAVIGRMATNGVAISVQNLMSMNALITFCDASLLLAYSCIMVTRRYCKVDTQNYHLTSV